MGRHILFLLSLLFLCGCVSTTNESEQLGLKRDQYVLPPEPPAPRPRPTAYERALTTEWPTVSPLFDQRDGIVDQASATDRNAGEGPEILRSRTAGPDAPPKSDD